MAEKDQGQSGKIGGYAMSDGIEILEAFAPSARVGEEAEIGRAAIRAVAAMVVGDDDVTRFGQGEREAFVAGAMLGEPMRDLHHRSRRAVRRPAAGRDRVTAARDRENFRFHAPGPLRCFARAYVGKQISRDGNPFLPKGGEGGDSA